MRIIGGALKGRRFNPPKEFPARPTTDFAKEGIFNILDNHYIFENIKALDLFSGTGNISYEFASRGCADVISVDENAGCIRFIEKTAAQLHIEGILPVQMDVFEYLELTTEKFDIIFADPPYEMDNIGMIEQLIFKNQLLLHGGWLIIEHKPKHSFDNTRHFKQARKYGSSVFSIFSQLLDNS